MPRSRTLVAVLAMVLAGVAGCSHKKDSSDLPDGGQLAKDSAAAMRAVTNARMTIEADTIIADVPLKRAEGVVTKDGDAQGSVQLEQTGTLVEFDFVVLGQTIHLK